MIPFRKAIKQITVACLLLAAFAAQLTSVSAENGNATVLYENTYNSKKTSAVNLDNELVTVAYNISGSGEDSEYNGNPGIAMKTTAYAYTTNGGAIVVTPKNPITSGVLNVSFDTSKLARDTANQSGYVVLNNVSNSATRKYVFYMNQNTMNGPANLLGGNGDASVTTPYDLNRVYHVSLYYDLNNSKAYTYVDDKILSVRSIAEGFSITQINFCLSMMNAYFDNLKIQQLENIRMEGEIREVNVDQNSIQVGFTDGIDEATLSGKHCTVTNLFSGEVSDASAVLTNSKLMRISPAVPFMAGYEYKLTLPDGMKGLSGKGLTESSLEFSAGTGNYLQSFRLKDAWGNILSLSGTNPAEINTLLFQFSQGVSAQDALNGMTVSSSDGTSFSYTISAAENKAEVTLNKYFTGTSVYTISLSSPALALPYQIPVKTQAGRLIAKAVSFQKGGQIITDASQISAGDTVTVKMDLIKTIPGAANFLASASLWNGLNLNDYDFHVITMGAEDQTAAASFDFTAASAEHLTIKAFLWKGLGQINPLCTEFVLQ